MTEGNKKQFSAREVIEAIFIDEDFDHGFVRLTQMMEQVIELIQEFVSLTQMIKQVIELS